MVSPPASTSKVRPAATAAAMALPSAAPSASRIAGTRLPVALPDAGQIGLDAVAHKLGVGREHLHRLHVELFEDLGLVARDVLGRRFVGGPHQQPRQRLAHPDTARFRAARPSPTTRCTTPISAMRTSLRAAGSGTGHSLMCTLGLARLRLRPASMLGASSWRQPPGRPLPVAASYLHAGNHFRNLGSTVTIDAAQDV